MSVRWQHCLDHVDNIQKPENSPDCLIGVVTQPTDSRLSEPMCELAMVPSASSVIEYCLLDVC